jgi:outer membrane lipopolysaccharide assembly protein LptE/RlpB
MTTKGVRLVSDMTWSTSPTQKIKVIAIIKARMAFVPNAVNSEYGMVLEASFAFSATHKISVRKVTNITT